jgi:hypothetical protein
MAIIIPIEQKIDKYVGVYIYIYIAREQQKDPAP